MKFSVVIIARNEEKTLPNLLASLKGVDEIIVMDTGSTDRTVEIAKECATVYEVGEQFIETVDNELEWKSMGILKIGEKAFNFSAARNYAASLAKNDMIFMPDADEVVEWQLDELPEADRLEYNYWWSHENGLPKVQFKHSKFYNRTKYKWVRIVHEVLQGEGETITTDKILLKHYQNSETKRGQYLTGLMIDYLVNDYNDRNTHYLGRELMYKGDYRNALRILGRHLENKGWEIEQGQSCIFMGDCYKAMGNIEQAKASYWKALEYALRREPLLALADLYYNEKNWKQASIYYELALKIDKIDYYANYEDNYTHYPHGQLSVCLYWLGKKAESLSHLKKALEYVPTNETYLNNLKFY